MILKKLFSEGKAYQKQYEKGNGEMMLKHKESVALLEFVLRFPH